MYGTSVPWHKVYFPWRIKEPSARNSTKHSRPLFLATIYQQAAVMHWCLVAPSYLVVSSFLTLPSQTLRKHRLFQGSGPLRLLTPSSQLFSVIPPLGWEAVAEKGSASFSWPLQLPSYLSAQGCGPAVKRMKAISPNYPLRKLTRLGDENILHGARGTLLFTMPKPSLESHISPHNQQGEL